MIRHRDPLTYRHPRTLIDAFGCDASSAVAGWHYRQNLAQRLASAFFKFGAFAMMVAAGVVGLLAYFDVLVK